MFPVPLRSDVIAGTKTTDIFIIVEDLSNLLGRPDEELSFHALRVGVSRRIKSPLRIGHLPKNIVQYLRHNMPIRFLLGDLVGLEIGSGKQCIVIELSLIHISEPTRLLSISYA